MPAVTILAIDPATSTGWACSDGRSGEIDFDNYRLKSCTRTERHRRIGAAFQHWLDALLSETEAGIVYIESTPTLRLPRQISDGLRMIALLTCGLHERVPIDVAPAQWQPWARKTLGWEKIKGKGGDEHDAKAMLAWALATQHLELSLTHPV